MQRRVFISASKNTPLRRNERVAKDLVFNYDEFKSDIATLRANANVKVGDATSNEQVASAFQRVRNTLHTMSGEKSYTDLRNIIDEKFNDLVKPLPYTIGAHFRGWNIKTNMDGTDFEPCVAVRIGALQKPGYVSKCKYVAMYADWSGDRFSFNNDIVERSTDTRPMHKVVINVPFTTVNTFPGFSAEEKDELRRNDITEACIIGFRPGSNDYVHLTRGEFISIDNIKTRYSMNNRAMAAKPTNNIIATQQHKHKHDDDCNDGYGAAAWIFFILIIFIIIVLFYFFWK